MLIKEQFSTCHKAAELNISVKKYFISIAMVPEKKVVQLKVETLNDGGSCKQFR